MVRNGQALMVILRLCGEDKKDNQDYLAELLNNRPFCVYTLGFSDFFIVGLVGTN